MAVLIIYEDLLYLFLLSTNEIQVFFLQYSYEFYIIHQDNIYFFISLSLVELYIFYEKV